MTHVRPRAWFAGCAVAASALLLASCTSGGGDGAAAGATTSSAAAVSASQAAAAAQEKKLTDQAQAALAAVQGGTMVEAGAERVTDGIHTEPSLSQGRTYRLSLVCAGSGTAHVTFTPASTGPRAEVPCDRSVVRQRIVADKLPVRVDVEGADGSTGVIAWQIDTV